MAIDADLIAELRDLRDRIRDLETGIPLQNASVSAGRLRFIGGLLRIDSGGRLEVVGSATIDGSTTVNGTFVLTGSGWRIVGSGTIEGPTTVTGTLKVDGDTRITGNLGLEGDTILVGNLSVEGGKIVSDDVRIEGGRIYIDEMVLDPDTGGGALTFPNGSRLEADASNGGGRLIAGDAVVNVGTVASLRKGNASMIASVLGITINAGSGASITLQGQVFIPLASLPTYAGTGLPEGTLRVGNGGRLERADGT